VISQTGQASLASAVAADGTDLAALKQAAGKSSPEALKAAAQQFEALFMNMVMKSMRNATPSDSPFDSEQSRMYTSMLDQKISEGFAKRGIGLADALMRQLSNNNGTPLPDGVAAAVGKAATTAWGSAAGIGTSSATTLKAAPAPGAAAQPSSTGDPAPAGPSGASGTPGIGLGERRYPAPPAHVRAFEQRLAPEAEAASRATGIPAKFMLGQAALESGWGKREIKAADGSASYNLFGIKATGGWKGKVVEATTTEYVDGAPQKKVEKFRAYDSYAAAFQDYAGMLRNNPRYRNVVANAQDAGSFAQGLQRAGYATDPNYAAKLTRLIKQSLSA
jgi:flagellar protein FlgJ